MNEITIARNFKDRLFVRLFGDRENKRGLLSLYNALNGTSYADENDLQITTIEDVVYMGMKNDVSCMIDNTMALYEHQSSFNPNMPLRGFLYAAKLYSKYAATQNISIYSDIQISLPTPQYYVFYNGTEEMKTEDRIELRMSDAFGNSAVKDRYEWTAIMLNINAGRNRDLMEKCRLLKEYAMCVAKVRVYTRGTMDWKDAIRRAIDDCIEEGILADFLMKHKAEVVDMLLTEYDEQKVLEQLRREYKRIGVTEGYESGLKEGHESGLKEGRESGLKEGHEAGVRSAIFMTQFVVGKLTEMKRLDELELAVKDEKMLLKYAEELGYFG